MDTLHRTLWSFAGFLINLFLVARLHEGLDPSTFQSEINLVTIVMVTMMAVAMYQRDATYFFGGLAITYLPLIVLKAGLAIPSLVAVGTTGTMAIGLGWIPVRAFRFLLAGPLGLIRLLGRLGGGFGQKRVLGRIRSAAQTRDGGELLGEKEVNEFRTLEGELARITAFFNGSDPSLEKALRGTLPQMEALRKDFARLLLRESHLQGFLGQTDRESITGEMRLLEEETGGTKDLVVRDQLTAALAMKRQRLEEVDRLIVARDRIKAQRLQILEAVRGTFDKLNSLKFTDIHTLEASSNSISEGIRQVRLDLDDLEAGLLAAESLGRK